MATLDEVKARLRKAYLGKGGIHAVGINRAGGCIRVYLSEDAEPAVLEQVRKDAKPFDLDIVREDKPRMAAD